MKKRLSSYDYQTINNQAKESLEQICRRWLPNGQRAGSEWEVGSLAGESGRSLKIHLTGTKQGVWKDFSAETGGNDPVSLIAAIEGISQSAAAHLLIEFLNIRIEAQDDRRPVKPAPNAKSSEQEWQIIMPVPVDAPTPPEKHPRHDKPDHTYSYRDINGALLGCVLRWDEGPKRKKKIISWQVYAKNIKTGKAEWKWQGFPEPRPLYGLELLHAKPAGRVILCEGEKAVDACSLLLPDDVAMTWPGGSKAVSKADFGPLNGRDVVMWPDADDPGRTAMKSAARMLKAAGAKSIQSVSLPALEAARDAGQIPDGYDAADLLEEGWTPDRMAVFIRDDSSLLKPKTEQRTTSNQDDYANARKSHYSMESDGLWFREPKKDYISETWICAPFAVKYRARGIDGMGWRFVVLITDRDGVQRELTILDADIGTQDGVWHRTLADAGLKVDPSHRRHLGKYLLLQCDYAPRAICTETAGLLRDCYVLHARTIGDSAEPIIYVGADRNNVFVEEGELESWRMQIGRYCAGNSRLVLAVCMALAAPLLPLSDISESGGIHLFGASADGKTSTARVAASCFGRPLDYMTTWRNTSNATEGTAAKFNHFLLILDEIREASERDLQPTIMMLGNGGGKMRMRDNATLRDRLTWLILWLSTGEYSTDHYLESAGIKGDPGLAARQNDIPSDAGAGMGVFECLHEHTSPRMLAEHLLSASKKYHGVVGITWLEYITSHIEQIRAELPEMIDGMLDKFTSDHKGAESQVFRAMRRFALIAIAGELATKAGLTGWQSGEATAGVRKCVKAWLDQRGGAENLEQRRIMERLRDYIGRNWQGRFIPWDRAEDDHAPAKSDTVGFRRDAQISTSQDQYVSGTEFYITAEGWNEIFRGLDPARAGQVLMMRGVLVPGNWKRGGKQEQRPYTRVVLPILGRRQCYHVRAGMLELLGDMQEDED